EFRLRTPGRAARRLAPTASRGGDRHREVAPPLPPQSVRAHRRATRPAKAQRGAIPVSEPDAKTKRGRHCNDLKRGLLRGARFHKTQTARGNEEERAVDGVEERADRVEVPSKPPA